MNQFLSAVSHLRLTFTLALLIFLFNHTHAQINEWTWTTGDNVPGKPGVYGTKGVQNITNTPGGRSGAIQWKDGNGDLWLMGGFGVASATSGNLNDLWKFSIDDKQWTWVSGDNIPNQAGVYGTINVADIGNKPGARNASTSATDAEGNLWLFGGYGSGGYMNDLWKFNVSTGLWTWSGGDAATNKKGVYGTRGIADVVNKPGARYSAASCSDADGNIWLFGGYGYAASGSDFYLNDLWKFDVATSEWTWISGDATTGQVGSYGTKGTASGSNKPGARYSPAMWTDAAGNVWIFGGTGFSLTTGAVGGELNDLWKYDVLSGEWTWLNGDNALNQPGSYGTKGVASASNKPGGRHAAAVWKDVTGKTYIFGGSGFASAGGLSSLNDLWELDLSTSEWKWIGGTNAGSQKGLYGVKGTASAANAPGARYNAASWMDNDRQLWIFGGNGVGSTVATGYLNDLWSYQLPDITLPVEFINFFATEAGTSILLSWSTAQEINSDHFNIERSLNGGLFESIGRIAAAGQSSSELKYQFVDASPVGQTILYRIQQVDRDGRFMYSKIVRVVKNKSREFGFSLIANPVQNSLNFSVNIEKAQKLTIHVKNASGSIILSNDHHFNKGTSQYTIPVHKIASGVYYLTVIGEKYQESKVFIKL